MSDENESLDSTTSMVHLLENGSEDEIRMLLGGRERIRHTGIIRAGKQVPLKSCTTAEKELFAKLEAEGISYDEINRQMGGKPKSRESKLTMTNTDHFVIRDCDFKKISDADFILQKYADADGLVRRIPVFFTVTDIDRAIPHNFTGFNGSGQLRCKSFYDGSALKFKYLEKTVVAPKESDWKILDSDDEDAATKACGYKVTFSGMYRVNVVGLRGIGECLVPNRSWYGMGDAVALLKKLKKRLGRFDGLLGGQPFLELCKVQEYVMHEGKKSKQWIITLELSVDMMDIERYAEPQAVAARSASALSMLTGQSRTQVGRAELPPAVYSEPNKVAGSAPEPTPDAPVDDASGTTASPNAPALEAIKQLVAPTGLFFADMEDLFAAENGGSLLSDASVDEIREFYKTVKSQLKANSEQFVLDVKSMRA